MWALWIIPAYNPGPLERALGELRQAWGTLGWLLPILLLTLTQAPAMLAGIFPRSGGPGGEGAP